MRGQGLRTGLACLALLLLTACGDKGGGTAADDKSPSDFPSKLLGVSPSPTAPPTFLENESCRTGMGPIIDLFLANKANSLDYGTFDNRVEQLTKKVDAAVAPCSKKVNNPIRRAMYDFTLARVQWGIGRCDKTCIGKVTDNIREGITLAQTAQTQLGATA